MRRSRTVGYFLVVGSTVEIPRHSATTKETAHNEVAASSGLCAFEDVQPCWSISQGKRVLDVVIASAGLVLGSPLMALTAIAVKMSSPGPILFKQTRMGQHGRTFTIYKFRTMRCDSDAMGPSVTKSGDARLTASGAVVRRWKLDELPQLINVVLGDMSLVGPRPKMPHHQTHILLVRPGITGAASLAFRNEESVLQGISDEHLDAYQVKVLMPMKKALDDKYMRQATLLSDLGLMCKTVLGWGEQLEAEAIQRFEHSLASLHLALHAHGGANAEMRDGEEIDMAQSA